MTTLEKARKQVEQAKARYHTLLAREKVEKRKMDTRRKIILGGLLLDAAKDDVRFQQVIANLMKRMTREQDRKAFKNWRKPGNNQT